MSIYTAASLKADLGKLFEEADELELDLSAVPELDSAGFQLLAVLKRDAAGAGKRVSLVGHSAAVMKVLDLYNVAGAFGDPLVIPSSQRQH